jgi:hypothetical protein
MGATFRIELPVRPPEADAVHEIVQEFSAGNGASGGAEIETKKDEPKPAAAPRRELASVAKSTLGLGDLRQGKILNSETSGAEAPVVLQIKRRD